jgi:hypothetical protein
MSRVEKPPQGPHANVEGYHKPSADEAAARKRRNAAFVWVLIGFVALVFLITLAKMQGVIPERM